MKESEMQRWCVTRDGVVVNTILWDGETEYDPGEGLELIPEGTPGLVYPGPVQLPVDES